MQNHDTPLFAMIQAMTSAMPPSCLRGASGGRWEENGGKRPAAEVKHEACR